MNREGFSFVSGRLFLVAVVAAIVSLSGLLFYFSQFNGFNPITTGFSFDFLKAVFSIEFIGFVILAPAAIAIIALLCFYREKKEVYYTGLIGVVLGVIVYLALTGIDLYRLIIGIFLIISIFPLVETVFLRKEEFKSLVTARTVIAGARSAFIILALGIFVATSVSTLNNEEAMVKEFGDSLIGLSVSQGDNDIGSITADLVVTTQLETVKGITSAPNFESLREKDDAEVLAFVASMENIQTYLESDAARESIIKKIESNSQKKIVDFEYIRQQSPVIDLAAENYWLLLGFSSAFAFLVFANFVLALLAGVYAAGLRKIIEQKDL